MKECYMCRRNEKEAAKYAGEKMDFFEIGFGSGYHNVYYCNICFAIMCGIISSQINDQFITEDEFKDRLKDALSIRVD
jgi:hypothetical protein